MEFIKQIHVFTVLSFNQVLNWIWISIKQMLKCAYCFLISLFSFIYAVYNILYNLRKLHNFKLLTSFWKWNSIWKTLTLPLSTWMEKLKKWKMKDHWDCNIHVSHVTRGQWAKMLTFKVTALSFCMTFSFEKTLQRIFSFTSSSKYALYTRLLVWKSSIFIIIEPAI